MQKAKPVIKTFISIIVLLALFVGGGVGYTWYMGEYGPKVTSAAMPPAEKPASSVQVIKPRKPAPDAAVGASVYALTSPVAPGANASITVKTTPTATCTISVTYDKTASKDSGLIPKTANDFGVVSWTWTVDEAAPVGKWPAKVTCQYGQKSAVVVGELVVATTQQP